MSNVATIRNTSNTYNANKYYEAQLVKQKKEIEKEMVKGYLKLLSK